MTPELPPQRAPVFWFTGLPGAGKTTLAQAFAERLLARGQPAMVLDGDVIRRGLSADLGFSPEARRENIRRVAEVAKLLSDSGTVALAALITPLAADRQLAEAIVGEPLFVEVFVDAPLATCEARDPKGMYREARAGSRASFTGLSAPYERPAQPRLALPSSELSVAACVEALEQVFKAFRPATQ